MMFRQFFAMLTGCFLFAALFAAQADVVLEPEKDNDFYKQHRAQCVYLGRSFCVNSADGSVDVKKAPDSKDRKYLLGNGKIVYIECSCLYNGKYWGLAENTRGGWIRLDQMLVLYDYVAFEEDHFDELYIYDGDYAGIKAARSAVAWPWPGADTPLWTIENLNTESFSVSCAYKDEQGREWGFVTYLYGSRNIWICLSDPLSHDIPAFNPAPGPSVWVSETAHVDIGGAGRTENQSLALPIILVAALAAGTVVLIKVFWKPKKAEQGGGSDG